MSYEIKLHTISSFFQDRGNAGVCSYYFDIIKIGNGNIARVNNIMNIGSVVDSNITNFKGVELSIIKLKKYLKNNNISIKNSKLIIYTNSSLLYESYNKLIPPLSVQRYINSFRRIKKELLVFNSVEIFYIPKNENKSYPLLNSFKNFIDNYKNLSISVLLKSFNNNEDIIKEKKDILNKMNNIIVDENFTQGIRLGKLIENKRFKSINNNKLNEDNYNINSKNLEEDYSKNGFKNNNQSIGIGLKLKINSKVSIKKIDKKVIIEMDEEIYNKISTILKKIFSVYDPKK